MSIRSRTVVSAVVVVLATAAIASATSVVFTGTDDNRGATATFSQSGNNLLVTLANTFQNDVMVPNDVLTAVFFDVKGNPTLTRVSAMLSSGSTILFAPTPGTNPPGSVGGEWAYKNGLSIGSGVGTQGISSSGLGPFGPGDRFSTLNLQGPDSPDGLQYGLTSAGDNPQTGNNPVTGQNALIQDSVDFTLGGLPAGFILDTDSISNVYFQYGTDLCEPRIPGCLVPPPATVPEPLTMFSAFAAIGSLVGYIGRRAKA